MRKYFLLLLLLIPVLGTGQNLVNPYTNTNSSSLFVVIGDSNSGDNTSSTAYGPTTAAGVALKWNGSGLTDVATTDFNNTAGTHGTPWKKFCLDYNAATGKSVIIVNRASGGSEFYPNGDNNNWYTSGTLYASMQSDLASALAFVGKLKPDAFFIHLGVNDIVSANTTTDILTGMTSLFTRLLTDYPGVKIYIVNTGVDNLSLGMTARKFFFKKSFRDFAQNNADIEQVCNLDSFEQWGYGDGIHLIQDGYNKEGELFARTLTSSETNKEVRQVLTYFHDKLNSTHEAAVKTFVEGMESDGTWIYTNIDCMQIYVSTYSKKNVFLDFTNIQTPLDDGFDWVSGVGIHTDNTPKTLIPNFIPSICAVNTTVTDFINGTKTGTNLTSAGTQGVLWSNPVGSLRRVFQTATSVINYNVNDATNTTYSGDTKILDDTRYATTRNGTAKALHKNSTQVSSATVSAGALSTSSVEIGGATSQIDCQFKYFYNTQFTGTTLSTFEGRIETLITALATP